MKKNKNNAVVDVLNQAEKLIRAGWTQGEEVYTKPDGADDGSVGYCLLGAVKEAGAMESSIESQARVALALAIDHDLLVDNEKAIFETDDFDDLIDSDEVDVDGTITGFNDELDADADSEIVPPPKEILKTLARAKKIAQNMADARQIVADARRKAAKILRK